MSVAVVGCGYWGKNLVRNMDALGALSIVCDADPGGLETARRLAPQARLTADFDDVLASDVAGVVLATPAVTHAGLVSRALAAGKDVLVEKPLALTWGDGADIVTQAEARGRILMVGHVLEYHPAVVRLVELARSGHLGDLQYVYSNRLSLGKIRREENILWSFAPHDIAIILRLSGERPERVWATGGAWLQPDIADVTLTSLEFPSGLRGHIHVSWLHPFKEQRLVVVGSRRMASFDDVGKRLEVYDQRVDVVEGVPVPVKGDGELIDYGSDEPLRRECEAFLDAIATRRPPLTDGVSGLAVLAVLEAAQQSLRDGGSAVPLADAQLAGAAR